MLKAHRIVRPLCLVVAMLTIQACITPELSTRAPSQAVILPHALAKAGKVYVCEREGWSETVRLLDLVPTNGIITVPSFDARGMPDAGDMSAWTTDEWLFAWKNARNMVIHMPGDQGLAEWGARHFTNMISQGLYVNPFQARDYPENRYDEGGAVMASPPVPGFPLGRIIVARDIQAPIKDFFRRQAAQAGPAGKLIELDTSWLKVGHVDELINFMPSAAPPGFKLVYPDSQSGFLLLQEVPPNRAIFTGPGAAEHTGIVTTSGNRWIVPSERLPEGKWKFVRIWRGKGAGQVARIHSVQPDKIVIEHVWNTADFADKPESASPARGMAAAVEGRCDSMPIWFVWPDNTSKFLVVSESRMWMDASGEEFPAFMAVTELADDPEFHRVNKTIADRCASTAKLVLDELKLEKTCAMPVPALFAAFDTNCVGAFAFTPSLVNFQVLDTNVVTLLPCGPRSNTTHGDSDVFLHAAKKSFSDPAVKLHFVDGWNALHRQNGGARCGMNVWRTRE